MADSASHDSKTRRRTKSEGSTAPRHSKPQAPKKGGGGGKHTWGKAGDEALAPTEISHGDPNYDPETDEENVSDAVTKCDLTIPQIDQVLDPVIKEFFSTGDIEEVKIALAKATFGDNAWHICELVILMGLDRTDAERELCSNLLSSLYGTVLKEVDFEKAFTVLLSNISDTVLDEPTAPDDLGRFLARAVADDCLAPAFINSHPAVLGDCPNPSLRAAVKKAHTLLCMKHGMARLDQVWGIHGTRTPVNALVGTIGEILSEYLNSEDCNEVERLLHELGVPHFHHEVVFECIMLALSKGDKQREPALVLRLLQFLARSNFFTPNQIEEGFGRIFREITDIVLDIPNGYDYLEKFVNDSVAANIIPVSLKEKIPPKMSGRKRNLSENDTRKSL